MRFLFCSVLLFLISSCSDSNLGNKYKSENGLFICTITAISGEVSSCDQHLIFDSKLPFYWAAYGKEKSDPELTNSVILLGSNIHCQTKEEFFPVALLNLKSETQTIKIPVGIQSNASSTPKEVTNFFQFQINYPTEMKNITEWIEKHYEMKWIAESWEDEKSAKSYLERINKGF